MVTVGSFIERMITQEQETYLADAQRVAELAAHIANTPPSATRAVSGDLTRLSQHVADLLRRAAKLEATIEMAALLEDQGAAS
ncbi:hypothetical protein [Streptomyces vinaceus]|uniref:hypothetical protein n=1 Tax=Streptomyces vinaceus TaxID=1960 RepID=UPI0036BA4502